MGLVSNFVFGCVLICTVTAINKTTVGPIVSVNTGCINNINCSTGAKFLINHDQFKEILSEINVPLDNKFDNRYQGCKDGINVSITPRDCTGVKIMGYKKTGVYTIYPMTGLYIQVRCDMDTAGGGWTVIQRRVSASDFYQTWNEYKIGFGDLDGNFWLGNDNIYTLTNSANYSLRVDLTAPDGQSAYAEYHTFSIGDEQSQYRLSISGYSGTAGDSLVVNHNGMKFSTKDRDNDLFHGSCAVSYTGAWWYAECHSSNLNGYYGNPYYAAGLSWYTWKGMYVSMVRTEMKIRRI